MTLPDVFDVDTDTDETTPVHQRYCDFCGGTGHGLFTCTEREAWHEEQTLPDAARRLDPVCQDPA
jgi:hypothetical protein